MSQNPVKISAHFQVFNNKEKTEKVLKSFREHNPDSFIYLVNDGNPSVSFSSLAYRYNCMYVESSFNCGYHSHDNPKVVRYRSGIKDSNSHPYGYNKEEARVYLSRVFASCQYAPEDVTHILFLEDDVFINTNLDSQTWLANCDVTHPHFNNKIPKELFPLMGGLDMGISPNLDSFGVCGGNFISKDLFISNYIKFGGKFIEKYDEIYEKMGNVGWNDSLLSVFMGLYESCRVGKNLIYSEHDRNSGVFHDRGHRIG